MIANRSRLEPDSLLSKAFFVGGTRRPVAHRVGLEPTIVRFGDGCRCRWATDVWRLGLELNQLIY